MPYIQTIIIYLYWKVMILLVVIFFVICFSRLLTFVTDHIAEVLYGGHNKHYLWISCEYFSWNKTLSRFMYLITYNHLYCHFHTKGFLKVFTAREWNLYMHHYSASSWIIWSLHSLVQDRPYQWKNSSYV